MKVASRRGRRNCQTETAVCNWAGFVAVLGRASISYSLFLLSVRQSLYGISQKTLFFSFFWLQPTHRLNVSRLMLQSDSVHCCYTPLPSPSCWFFFDKQYNQLAIKSLLTKYMLARMHTHPSEATLPRSLMRPTASNVTPLPSSARTRLDPAKCTSSSRRPWLSPLARSTHW